MSTTHYDFALNLEPNWNPLPKTLPIAHKSHVFPGGEQHFMIQTDLPAVVRGRSAVIITARVKSGLDLVLLILATDAVKRQGFQKVALLLPCFPGSRQDRVCVDGEPFTLKVFAGIINSLEFSKVYIYAPHSEVTPALIENVEVLDLDAEFVRKIIYSIIANQDLNCAVINIVCPDAGAGKRVAAIFKTLGGTFGPDTLPKLELVKCEKERDVFTGALKEFIVMKDSLGGAPCLILDDVIAFGGTFIGLAEALRKKGAGSVSLFTSHADCLAGLANAANSLDQVYTTDSKNSFDRADLPENVTIFNLKFQ